MNPPWAIDEYPSSRTMLVWRRAMRLPTVIESAARTHSIGPHSERYEMNA